MDTRLYRSRDDRMIAGVAGGLADYLGLDPSLVRIGWAIFILVGGLGLVVYIIMAIVVPEEPELGSAAWSPSTNPPPAGEPATAGAAGATQGPPSSSADWRSQRNAEREARRAARRARRGDGRTASLLVGGFLVLLGVGFLVREYIPQINFDFFWPLVLVGLGVVVLAAALRPSGPDDSSGTGGPS